MRTSPWMRPGRIVIRCDCIACAWWVKYVWTVSIADTLVDESLMGDVLVGMASEPSELCIDESLMGDALVGMASEPSGLCIDESLMVDCALMNR